MIENRVQLPVGGFQRLRQTPNVATMCLPAYWQFGMIAS
jgi:hypothetical protein